MTDETVPEQQAARAAAARWAIELLEAHPELMELIPPKHRFLYAPIDKKADHE